MNRIKQLNVKKLATVPLTADAILQLMDKGGVDWHPMDCSNWHDLYGYYLHIITLIRKSESRRFF